MNTANHTDYEELSIGTVAGLQAFLSNAQAQYNAGLQLEAESVSEAGQGQEEALHHAFQTLRHTTNKLINKKQNEGTVEQTDAEQLQGDYDELLRVVNELQRLQKDKSTVSQKLPEPSSTASGNESEPTKPTKKTKKQPSPTKSNSHEHPSEMKPKTGTLKVSSDDTDVVDAGNRVSVSNTKLRQKSESSPRTSQSQTTSSDKKTHPDSNKEIAKIQVVITKSQRRYEELKKKHTNPSLTQDLLFEEVREGIEHLELLTKKPKFKTEQLLSVSEVAAHIKDALEGIVEDDRGTKVKSKVPFVSKLPSRKTSNHQSSITFVPTSVTARRSNAAKRSVPKQLQTLPKPDDIYQQESLTKKYLTAQRHVQFLQAHYSSSASFEQILDATITKIESDTIDSIEKWLGDLPASAFSFLKEMTVDEMAAFANRPYEVVTQDLRQQNIKYETFVAWRDLLDEMLEIVPNGDNMKFGELFANWMLELAMSDDG